MKLCAIVSVLAVLILVHSNPAYGYVVTVEVEGTVTEVQTWDGLEFDGSVIVGSIMTGSATYDMEAPDQKPQYDWVGCYSLISISMNIGSYTFLPDLQATREPYFYISAGTSSFYYDVVSPEALFYGPCYLNGEPTNLEDLPSGGFGMSLVANINSPIGDALPDEETFPDLSVFDENRVFLIDSSSTPAFIIFGEVTNITVIPEPASVLLLGFGGLALRLRSGQALLRKRRR